MPVLPPESTVFPSPTANPEQSSTVEVLPPVRFAGTPAFYLCEPGWSWSPRPLQEYELWCVLEGRGKVVWEDNEHSLKEHSLNAGSCFVWAPGTAPHAEQDPDHVLRIFACRFDFEVRSAAGNFWGATRPALLHDLAFFADTARYCALCYSREDAVSRGRAVHLLQQLLWQFRDEAERAVPSPRDSVIAQIVRAIREDPGARWNVDDLSARAGLSPSQFTRRFTALTGSSPAHFVVQTRLERARNLLNETTMTVRAISDALGYHDVHFFCRQFKAFTGQTPGSLRNQ